MNNSNIGLVGGGLSIFVGMLCMGVAPNTEYLILAGVGSVMGGIVVFMSMMTNDR